LVQKLDKALARINVLESIIVEKDSRIAELESQLSKNSRNSHHPPSSDGPKKKVKRTNSLRTKSGKSSGGQKENKGTTLKRTQHPDYIVEHKPTACLNCTCTLNDVNSVFKLVSHRQVFDIPPSTIEVTEHRQFETVCTTCNHQNSGDYPLEVKYPVQYGSHIRRLCLYLHGFQFLPSKRIVSLLNDCFNICLSEGSVYNFIHEVEPKLDNQVRAITNSIIEHKVIHSDETGVRCSGSNHWVHTASTANTSLFFIHPKRGKQALDEWMIYNNYEGILVHDFWKPYYNLCTKIKHALCNAHHLRDLEFIHQAFNERWAKQMFKLLLKINDNVKIEKEKGYTSMGWLQIKQWLQAYRAIIHQAIKEHPPPVKTEGKRGRIKKGKVLCMLERLRDKEHEVLRFLYDFTVPFTNNLAEQAIRMFKVKLKISGCFRTLKGAKLFCKLRTVIDTARKRGINPMKALEMMQTNQLVLV